MAGDSKWWLSLMVIVGSVSTIARAQILVRGPCPSIDMVSAFNVDQYLGKWFANRNYFSISQAGLDCVTVEYTRNGDGIVVKNEAIEQVTRKIIRSTGNAHLVEPGQLSVSYSDSLPSRQATLNYMILGTDYKSYSVAWNCFEWGPFSSRTVWVLTREQEPSVATIDKVYAVLRRNGLDSGKLRLVNQKNCTRR